MRNQGAPSSKGSGLKPSRSQWLLALAGYAACAAAILSPQHVANLVLPQADLAYHLNWTTEFAEGLAQGVWYPRWLPEEKLGLGDPTFLYYPPLYSYAVAGVRALVDDTWAAMRAVEFIAAVLAGFGMFMLCRRWVGGRMAFAAGLMVQFSPMVVGLLYSFNARPWFTGVAPGVLVLYCVLTPGRRLWDPRLSLAAALLTATHVLSAFALLLCLPLAYAFEERRIRLLASYAMSAGFGLALVAVYLLPALANTSLVSPAAWDAGVLDWHGAFAFPAITSRVFPLRWFGYQWIVPLAMLASVGAVGLYLRRVPDGSRSERQRLAGLAAVCCMALVLASEASYPLWAILPPLQRMQFPYRFLSVVAIVLPAALIPCLARVLALEQRSFWRWTLGAAIAVQFAVSGMILFRTVRDSQPIGSFIQTNVEAPHVGAPEYLPAQAGPQWREWAKSGGFAAEAAKAGIAILAKERGSGGYSWRLSCASQAEIRFPVFAFPAWRLSRNGVDLAYAVDRQTGLIQVKLPAGTQDLRLEWQGAPWEDAGRVISAAALAVLLMGLAGRLYWRRSSGDAEADL